MVLILQMKSNRSLNHTTKTKDIFSGMFIAILKLCFWGATALLIVDFIGRLNKEFNKAKFNVHKNSHTPENHS